MHGRVKQWAAVAMVGALTGVLSGCSGESDDEPGRGAATPSAAADPALATTCEEMRAALPAEIALRYPAVTAVVDSIQTAAPTATDDETSAKGRAVLACNISLTLTGSDDRELGVYTFQRTVDGTEYYDQVQGTSTLDQLLYVERTTSFSRAQTAIATAVVEVHRDGGKLPSTFSELAIDLPADLTVPYYRVSKKKLALCLEQAGTAARALLRVDQRGASSMTGPSTGDCSDAAAALKGQ